MKRLVDHPLSSNGFPFRLLGKFSALAIPVVVLLAGLFLPLQDIIRQALIGVVFIWIYLGAMTGFSFLW